MDQYTPAELSELYLQSAALIDAQFQFWITITFAVIVAGYIVGDRLKLGLRYCIAPLYLVATLVVFLRVFNMGGPAVAIATFLDESGVLIFEQYGQFTVWTRMLYVVLGTALAVYFVLAPTRASRPKE